MYCFSDDKYPSISCSIMGICGKDPAVDALQNLLLFGLMGLSVYAHRLRMMGIRDKKIDALTLQILFTTVVNVNFDKARLKHLVIELSDLKKYARDLYLINCREKNVPIEEFCGPAEWEAKETLAEMIREGERLSVQKSKAYPETDIADLRDLVIHGVKGISSFIDYAKNIGKENSEIYDFFYELLDSLCDKDLTEEKLKEYISKCGKVNLEALKLLEDAIVERYGSPVHTSVRLTPLKGKAILVSGNDLKELEEILKQTEGKGINVYTHGDMIAAHSYPELKKFPQLVGNYGATVKNQQADFQNFPGAVLLTTNCAQGVGSFCRGRLFTTGLISAPGIMQLTGNDFKPVIKAAYDAEGFLEDGEEKSVIVGYSHNGEYNLSLRITEAIKNKQIKHVFIIGGCDGAIECEAYYSRFLEIVPDDCIIMTLNVGRQLFSDEEYGEVAGIPRFIEMGQCNTVYTVFKIAESLSKSLGLDMKDIPMSLFLSWYDQKTISFLMTLLNFGFDNVKLGPGLPIFVPPNVYKIMLKTFSFKPLTCPDDDLKDILG